MQILKNYMEDCVEDVLQQIISALNCCTCEKCQHDIKAIALNSLPPKYVVTPKGEIYAKINTLQNQFDVDIIAAITRASDIIKKNPRHEVK